MTPRRYIAAALAAVQVFAGSAAVADVIDRKWIGLLVVLVAAGQAFLSALGSADAGKGDAPSTAVDEVVDNAPGGAGVEPDPGSVR